MDNNYDISEFDNDGFLHSRIKNVKYYHDKKKILINMHAADLRNGAYITTVTLSISDWWSFEVHEKGSGVDMRYDLNDIPIDIEQIFRYEYDGATLTLVALGFKSIDAVVYYKFLHPKIKITGEYEPD